MTSMMNSNISQITIESGLLKNLGRLLKEQYPNKKIMIVTDENVYSIYGPTLEKQITETGCKRALLILPPGEKSKTQETLFSIYGKLLSDRFTREDVILAVGGGTVGDVTGLAASTYLRGINLIQLPTTLTAQADSSMGGKNGINLPEGKNLVGTFYQPGHIWIDPKFLGTLDKRDVSSGMAEVIKYALITDADFFEELLLISHVITDGDQGIDSDKCFEEIIKKCCEIKMKYIEEDVHERGRRIMLNYGHTIGHGIERYYDYTGVTHGEAVAIGMSIMARKSEEMGLSKKGTADLVEEILKIYGLPTTLSDSIDIKRLYNMTLHDKKHSGNEINLIILPKIGESIIHKVDHEQLMDFLNY